MSWKVVREHVDKRLGQHIVHFEERESGAQHRLQIFLGADLDGLDPKQLIADELKALQAKHDAMDAYAKKHRIAVRKP
jgi:hypothetical protein